MKLSNIILATGLASSSVCNGYIMGEWVMKLFFVDGTSWMANDYLKHKCIPVPGGPHKVWQVEHQNSGFTNSFTLFRDDYCQKEIPMEEVTGIGTGELGWTMYKLKDTVGSFSIW